MQYTYAEYLSVERMSNVRHEFFDGQIYAMAGGTPEHAARLMSVGAQLYAQLRDSDCATYSSDLRVRTPSGLSTYPDVTIVCGATESDPEDDNAVTNPTVIVEVLSKSTEAYDRGDKFAHYKSVPSIRQVVFVGYREPAIEVWTRGGDGTWAPVVAREGEVAELAVGARIDVREVYAAGRRHHSPAAS